MPETVVQVYDFTAGMMTPYLLGRVDLDKYHRALRNCRNMIARIYGPVAGRPGTYYVSTQKFAATRPVRLRRFVFSNDQQYMLEFGHEYVRVHRDGVLLMDGGNPVEIATCYGEANLPFLKFHQSRDVLYMTDGVHAIKKLERTGLDTLIASWPFGTYRTLQGPLDDVNTDDGKKIKVDANSGNITITATFNMFAATDAPGGVAPFDWPGRIIRARWGEGLGNDTSESGAPPLYEWGDCTITAVNSPTEALATVNHVFNAIDGTRETPEWAFGTFSQTSGWPKAGTFIDQAQVFVGMDELNPQRVWKSVPGDFNRFREFDDDDSITDKSAVRFDVDDDQVNTLHSAASVGRGLALLSGGGEFLMRSSGLFTPITPTDVGVRMQSTWRTHPTVPFVRVHTALLFTEITARKIIELAYAFDSDQYVGTELTKLCSHLAQRHGGLVDMAYCQVPDPIIWAAFADGVLMGITYDKNENVIAAHEHPIGGDGVVESMDVIRAPGTQPADVSQRDELWLSVKRTISGVVTRTNERLASMFPENGAKEDAYYVDCGLTYIGAATAVINGLDHLNGATVSILADGNVVTPQVVADGQVTLPYESSKVHVGFGYEQYMEPMPLVPRSTPETRGRIGRPVAVKALLHRSIGAQYALTDNGVVVGAWRALPTRTPQDDPFVSPPLFTGYVEETFDSIISELPSIAIRQTQPLPLEVLSLAVDLELGDR